VVDMESTWPTFARPCCRPRSGRSFDRSGIVGWAGPPSVVAETSSVAESRRNRGFVVDCDRRVVHRAGAKNRSAKPVKLFRCP